MSLAPLSPLNGPICRRLTWGEVVMEGADLHETNLQRAYLYAAKLQGARLGKVKLSGADLTKANLSGVDRGRNHRGAISHL